MPVCHYCNKNNLYTDVDVFQVREDVARPSFRTYTITGELIHAKSHRICDKCIDKYEKKHGITLTILKQYHSKKNPITISQRKMERRRLYEVRRSLK